jgi:rubrerythrin
MVTIKTKTRRIPADEREESKEFSDLLEEAMRQPGVAELAKVYDRYRQFEKVNTLVNLFQNPQTTTVISLSTSSVIE